MITFILFYFRGPHRIPLSSEVSPCIKTVIIIIIIIIIITIIIIVIIITIIIVIIITIIIIVIIIIIMHSWYLIIGQSWMDEVDIMEI